jgi:tRNA U34 5-methylaminomethyl-2-thiouridine-forming methyltransferase MnmC
MKREIRITRDGSPTLYLPELDEHYHSTHGAVQEARHVFIENGLRTFTNKDRITILEVGFGSGLNALLTCLDIQFNPKISIEYVGIESHPLNREELELLDYSAQINDSAYPIIMEKINTTDWDLPVKITPNFNLVKTHSEIQKFAFYSQKFDLIYYDAFGPRAQSEMWEKSIFEPLYASLKENGILVTYCAQGQFKRNLKEIGFSVESRPGPPGKREMTVAKKIVNI